MSATVMHALKEQCSSMTQRKGGTPICSTEALARRCAGQNGPMHMLFSNSFYVQNQCGCQDGRDVRSMAHCPHLIQQFGVLEGLCAALEVSQRLIDVRGQRQLMDVLPNPVLDQAPQIDAGQLLLPSI